jgi:hypothetical protein
VPDIEVDVCTPSGVQADEGRLVAADAGFAGVGRYGDGSKTMVRARYCANHLVFIDIKALPLTIERR